MHARLVANVLRPRDAERLRRFEEGCKRALEACSGPPLTDAEHNDLARRLGRPDLQRDLQRDLPLGPDAA